MNNTTFKALSLAIISAAGTSEKALYSALTTEMFFGQVSALTLRVEKGVVKPYFTVPLPALDGLNVITRKQLLLTSCLQETAKQLQQLTTEMPIKTIEQLIITTSLLNSDEMQCEQLKAQWQSLAQACVEEDLPDFSTKVQFTYSNTHSASIDLPDFLTNQTASFERPVLVINIDSLLEYHDVRTLSNKLEVQCLGGSAGIMPAEGATSTLFIPKHYPNFENKLQHKFKSKQIIHVESLNSEPSSSQQPDIKTQLMQAGFSLPSTVLHLGTLSEKWLSHWYSQTQSFYHQQNKSLAAEPSAIHPLSEALELIQYDQTKVLGYLGSANLTMALASATALLVSPMTQTPAIWLVAHSINSKNTETPIAKVYKITLAMENI